MRGSADAARLSTLEQLHDITGRILAQDLPSARPVDDVVAERHTFVAQDGDRLSQIHHLDHEAVPAAGFGPAAVGHWSGGRGGRASDPQCEILSGQDRDRRPELLLYREAEMLSIEAHGRVDVMDEIPDC